MMKEMDVEKKLEEIKSIAESYAGERAGFSDIRPMARIIKLVEELEGKR